VSLIASLIWSETAPSSGTTTSAGRGNPHEAGRINHSTAHPGRTVICLQYPNAAGSRNQTCARYARRVENRAGGSRRTSPSDDRDLAARATIDVAFLAGDDRAGIAIAAHQSLVTTFPRYQGLSYLGTTAVD
jgi:hypothetical protein